jgi:lysozyme family protein
MTDIVGIAFQREGDNAKDPGGPICYGIIQTLCDAYLHTEPFAVQSVKDVTLAEAEDIYRALGEFARAA